MSKSSSNMKQIVSLFFLSFILCACIKDMPDRTINRKEINVSITLETIKQVELRNINCYVFADDIFYKAWRNLAASDNQIKIKIPAAAQLYFLTNTEESSSLATLEENKTTLSTFIASQNNFKVTDSSKIDEFYSGMIAIKPSITDYKLELTNSISKININANATKKLKIDSIEISNLSQTTYFFEGSAPVPSPSKLNTLKYYSPPSSNFIPDVTQLYESDSPINVTIHGSNNTIPVIINKTLDKVNRNKTYTVEIEEEDIKIKMENTHQLYADSRNRLDMTEAQTKQIQPGDIIFLRGGFLSVRIIGLKGTAEKPVRITNYPGETLIIGNPDWSGGAYSSALQLLECQHVIIGSEESASNFRLEGSTQKNAQASYFGLNLSPFTDNIEVKNMTITNGGIGIMAKTNPVKEDPKTWHPNSKLENLSIHDLEISQTKGEAMYLGHSSIYWGWDEKGKGYNAGANPTNPAHTYVEPIRWKNVKIYKNQIHDLGYDGIQTSTIGQLEIYENEVSNFGTDKMFGQCMGILVGGNTTNTYVHDNYVHDGYGEAFQFHGSNKDNSTHIVENNLFVNSQSNGIGIYGLTDAATIYLFNNTVANCYSFAVQANGKYHNTQVKLSDNVYIACYLQNPALDTYIRIMNNAIVEQSNDQQFNSTIEAKVDQNNFYSPLPGSTIGSAGYHVRNK